MGEFRHHIRGYENQIIELILEPEQRIQAEKGAMTYMTETIRMNTRLGERTGLFRAMKRKMAGESLLINEFTNESRTEPAAIALSPARPSRIMHIALGEDKPAVVCQRDGFLAGGTAVHIDIIRGRLGPAMLTRASLIMQKLTGHGDAFITGNGTVICRRLKPGERIMMDLDALVAFDETVHYDVSMMKGVRNVLWGGESLFTIETTGPGRVWMQSLSRFEIASAHIEALIKNEGKLVQKR